jgi:hypothetical protein
VNLGANEVLALLIAGGVLLALFGILAAVLHSRRERLLSHEERMKALELGRELPEDVATAKMKASQEQVRELTKTVEKSLPVQCYTITGWTAGCGMLFAAWGGAGGSVGVPVAIAGAAAAVGVTGMICGTILATKMPGTSTASVISKGHYDPEAV